MKGRVMQETSLSRGLIYTGTNLPHVPGSFSDVLNMEYDGEVWNLRGGTDRAYGSMGANRPIRLFHFYLTTGHEITLAIHNTGWWSFMDGFDSSSSITTVGSGSALPYTTMGAAIAVGEAIYVHTGVGRAFRLIPSWNGGYPYTVQYAGCFPPLNATTDTAIGYTVEVGGPGGLNAGTYWLCETILFGDGGKYGESKPGAITEVVVPTSMDGVARIVSSGTGLPAAGTTYIPGSDMRYYGAWGRRLRRSKSAANGGSRNGPFYWLQDKYEMTSTNFETYIPDGALSAARIPVKYLDEADFVPPIAQFAERHGSYVVLGAVEPNRIWQCELSDAGTPHPDRVDPVGGLQSLDQDPSEIMTGMVSLRGSLIVFTNKRTYEVGIGSSRGARVVSDLGAIAPVSIARVRSRDTGMVSQVIAMTSDGVPMSFDGAFWRPLGDEAQQQSIRTILRKYGLNLALCQAEFHEGQYIMSYPDSRDGMSTDSPCTRQLVWSERYQNWTWWSVPGMSCPVSTDRRLLYADKYGSNSYVMQMSSLFDTDKNNSSGSTQAIPSKVDFGNLAGSGMTFDIPVEAVVRYSAPALKGGAVPAMTVYVNGSSFATKNLVAAGISEPLLGRIAFPPKATRRLALSVGSTSNVGRWGISMASFEKGRRTL